MKTTLFRSGLIFAMCFLLANADPEFCTRGFKMASRFYQCWEQATFVNKYPPLHEPHAVLDSKFLEAYATHMCSVVKPQALKCLKRGIQECSNINKLMDMADHSGGACLGNMLNPYFKTHVIDRLTPLQGDSPCFELADNTYECYKAAGQYIMSTGVPSDDIVTFHRVADKFFNAYWECMVEIYRSNEKVCPHWQIPMLLTLQKTAMPSLFGLRLRPAQVDLLQLGEAEEANKTEVSNPGPSSLYILLQLHKTRPDVSDHEDSVILELSDLNDEDSIKEPRGGHSPFPDHEDSVILELSDLNDEDPKLELEPEENVDTGSSPTKLINPRSFTLKELKALLREQRRRNKELKDFLEQAKGGAKKRNDSKDSKKKPNKSKSKAKVEKKSKDREQRKLSLDRMIA